MLLLLCTCKHLITSIFLVFLLMLYMQKTGFCVSCYLDAILALYMHQLCVAGPFKYRCYVED